MKMMMKVGDTGEMNDFDGCDENCFIEDNFHCTEDNDGHSTCNQNVAHCE